MAPFVFFLLLTWCQGQFGEAGRYWFYGAKTVAGAGMVWALRPWIAEMRWALSWEAVAAGVLVFVLWVGLDGFYPGQSRLLRQLGLGFLAPAPSATDLPWNPHAQFGEGTGLAWLFVVVRLVGSALVVPPLEEVFYRSFLSRYLVQSQFDAVPLGHRRWVPIVLSAVVFGFAHQEWLAGILCGLIYQALLVRKGRLGDAMTAHAITNLLLGLWVVSRGAWKFW